MNRCARLSGDEVKVNRRRALHSSLVCLFLTETVHMYTKCIYVHDICK